MPRVHLTAPTVEHQMGRPTNRQFAQREELLRLLQQKMFLPARRPGESHGAYVRRCQAIQARQASVQAQARASA